jgi:hypothetical protein
MSFDALKKNRNAAIAALQTAAEKLGKTNYSDDRFWSPTVDKAGNGFAIIRFLPAPEGEDLPWVRYWDHGFKGQGGRWYIENSLTSLEQDDPVSEQNSLLWNSGVESDKEIARLRKRRLHYVSNILIISDPGNRDNEGKVFLFKYGKKIFDKGADLMNPQFPGEVPVNPFDMWDGADFKLKIRQFEGYRNYDKSEFAAPSPIAGTDEDLKAIYEQLNSLKQFLDPSNYKSYADLKRKLADVLGEEYITDAMTPEQLKDHNKTEDAPRQRSAPAPRQRTLAPADLDDEDTIGGKPPTADDFAAMEGDGATDDENLSYFAKLAAGSKA